MLSCYKKMSMTQKLYLSTGLGIFFGLFFGGRCAALSMLNILFIQIFQVAIIPFMIFSIIHAVGSMSDDTARLMGKRGGMVLLVIWTISIVFAFLLPLCFPDIQQASFFRPAEVSNKSVDIISMFVPSNPFHSLAEGYIPAIVIFCLLTGLAIIHTKGKGPFLQQIKFLSDVMSQLNKYIMATLPLGVLVIATYSFGTLDVSNFKEMLVYIIASLFYLLFISLVIYPALVLGTTSLSWKQLRDYSVPATLLAFSTGNVFLSLPLIYEAMNKFHDEQPDNAEISTEQRAWRQNIIEILVPLAWVVPASYKFLVVFFINFAAWYYNSSLAIGEKAVLMIAGIPALFGSNSVIVPFFLGMADLPEQAYNLFMLVANFLIYFNNANGAIFIIICTIMGYAAINGKMKIRWHYLLLSAIVCCVLFAGAVGGMRYTFAELLADNSSGKKQLESMEILPADKSAYANINLSIKNERDLAVLTARDLYSDLLEQIISTHTLRVGYIPETAPFAFVNGKNELVGFDIDMIDNLAGHLSLENIEFYPLTVREMDECLANGKLDIVVGGIIPRFVNKQGVVYSEPCTQIHPAMVMPLAQAVKFPDWQTVVKDKNVKLSVIRGSGAEQMLSTVVPKERIVLLDNRRDFFVEHKADIFVTSAEAGFMETIEYPLFKTIVISEISQNLFCAYPVAERATGKSFLNVVNQWLLGSFIDGTMKRKYDYWMLGKSNEKKVERWSVLDWMITKAER